ncbi:MAG: hypothetical protein A2Y71_03730 [Bacteroidetes bacterium RBG_13_42_15]|nr:MAG: hypothetical protein A2Y71_03730 [Bacteroidetes bacterium RBG_13_42_15]
MDFTIKTYLKLLKILVKQGFSFYTFAEFLRKSEGRFVILRHDVDKLPVNALVFAKIQYDLGLKGSYYFRAVPESWKEEIIRQISEMGHEVGYHYEDIALAITRQKVERPDMEAKLANFAIQSFNKNLEKLRRIVPVKTICMHGSPMNRWDNRMLWKYYDYRDFGIIGEPYFNVNFKEVLYLTDTGRRWDGVNYNIRDKECKYKTDEERTKSAKEKAPSPPLPLSYSFHTTFDIIKAAEEGLLPDKIMITFHPQRWTNQPLPWIKELVWQNTKNIAKYLLIKFRNK